MYYMKKNLFRFLLRSTILLILVNLSIGCIATLPTNKLPCEAINESMKICKDQTHENHCRIYINRKHPYPDTVTEMFLCDDTGYLGYKDRDDQWTRQYEPVSGRK